MRRRTLPRDGCRGVPQSAESSTCTGCSARLRRTRFFRNGKPCCQDLRVGIRALVPIHSVTNASSDSASIEQSRIREMGSREGDSFALEHRGLVFHCPPCLGSWRHRRAGVGPKLGAREAGPVSSRSCRENTPSHSFCTHSDIPKSIAFPRFVHLVLIDSIPCATPETQRSGLGPLGRRRLQLLVSLNGQRRFQREVLGIPVTSVLTPTLHDLMRPNSPPRRGTPLRPAG